MDHSPPSPIFPSRAALDSAQLTALQALLRELLPNNRFYTRKLEEAGVSADLTSREEFFRRAPFTTKTELVEDQQAFPPYGTNLTYPLDWYTRFSQTSGTSGTPMRWLDTTESWSWMVDNWVEVFRASGVTPEDRVFFAFSFGPFLGFWTAFEAGERLGCLCIPGGGMSSIGRLQAILDNHVTVVCCTPTYAIRLGEVAEEHGIDLGASGVRALVVAGEPGASIPATRERIEGMWRGARLWDHHGMTEIGPVTFECPARRGVLHVLEERFIPEVINPETGRPVEPGESGELVLTNLGRTGSPLLRYRTGDCVRRAAEPVCACGRSDLALEGGILGRTDDMVFVRGVNLFPSAFEAVVRRFEAAVEYRVEIRSGGAMAEAQVLVEPDPACPDTEAFRREVEDALRAAFNLRIPVSLAHPDSLPRFELKAKRWVHIRETGGNGRE